jgi:hypothetical protein
MNRIKAIGLAGLSASVILTGCNNEHGSDIYKNLQNEIIKTHGLTTTQSKDLKTVADKAIMIGYKATPGVYLEYSHANQIYYDEVIKIRVKQVADSVRIFLLDSLKKAGALKP